ncbi:hypothetical protein SNE40_014539 [Patella caerulea]|uniref:Fork-head domain-containing protein n=1 Tax=Patella caerulea TaxID=87958 RepID=A0AAN8JH42_PATCE
MSSVSRTVLAKRLLKNWFTKNSLDSFNTGSYDIDESLTGLSWLQNLDVRTPTDLPQVCTNIPEVTEVKNNHIHEAWMTAHPPVEKLNPPAERRDYKNNSSIKPTHSYATLISMAINETKEKKINISSIYKWITDKYSYYKMADSHWKNSIRHNLSLNKRFEKIPREQNESNKGGYWRIKPEFNDVTHTNLIKRANSVDSSNIMPSKRMKMEEDTLAVINNTSAEDSDGSNSSQLYSGMEEEEVESVSKTGFNWSSVLQQDIVVNGVRIKTENLLDEEDCQLSQPLADDITSYPMSSSVPNCDVNSDDLSCFDDLLVFNLDNTKDQQLTNDSALDLTSDTNGDHDWWQKALDLNEESNKISSDMNEKINRLIKSELFSAPDSKELFIPALNNVDEDVDICDLFDVGHVF